MKRLAMMVGLLIAVATAASAQKMHYQQNFDGLNNGDLDGQDGWSVGAPANMPSVTVENAVVFGNSGKAVQVDAMTEVVRVIEPKLTSGTHFISVFFRFENIVGDNTMHLYFGDSVREWNAGPVIRIGSQSGAPDMVGVHDGQTVVPVAPIRKGEWQHLMSVMNIDKQTYSVWVDEKLVADEFAWRNPLHLALGWWMIGFDAGAGLIGYYDEFAFGAGDTYSLDVSPQDRMTTTWGSLKSAR